MRWWLAAPHAECLLQFSALLRSSVYRGTGVPRGNGEPVLLIPGFFAGDWTLVVLGGWLRRIGYNTFLSGIDLNVGPPARTGNVLGWRLDHIARETGRQVVLAGHSLGGLLARFMASRFPGHIRHVVTLGSPIYEPLRATTHPLVRSVFRGVHSAWGAVGVPGPEAGFFQEVASPLPQGIGFTAIFSKEDEVVDWRACLDPQGDSQEVSGGHASLIVNPEAYRALAIALAKCTQGTENPWAQERENGPAQGQENGCAAEGSGP